MQPVPFDDLRFGEMVMVCASPQSAYSCEFLGIRKQGRWWYVVTTAGWFPTSIVECVYADRTTVEQ